MKNIREISEALYELMVSLQRLQREVTDYMSIVHFFDPEQHEKMLALEDAEKVKMLHCIGCIFIDKQYGMNMDDEYAKYVKAGNFDKTYREWERTK